MSAVDTVLIVLAGIGGAGLVIAAAYLVRILWTIATSGWRR